MRPIPGALDFSIGDGLEREWELSNLYRTGSAPLTVEGSLCAFGGFLGVDCGGKKNGKRFVSEEAIRSDPDSLSYYYSNMNKNPRLPPPLVSKEDWKLAQGLNGANYSGLGGIGDKRKMNRVVVDGENEISLFAKPPGFDSKKQENESEKARSSSVEWGGNGLIGLPALNVGNSQKSFAEILQDDFSHATMATAENQSCQSREGGQSYTYAAALGASLSRSTTPDPHMAARAPSPCPAPIGQGRCPTEKRAITSSKSLNSLSSSMIDSLDLINEFSGLNLSANGMVEEPALFSQMKQKTCFEKHERPFLMADKPYSSFIKRNASSPPALYDSYPKGFAGGGMGAGFKDGCSGHKINPAMASTISRQTAMATLPPLFEKGSFGVDLADPPFLKYSKMAEFSAPHPSSFNGASMDENYMNNGYANMFHLQKAYLGAFLLPHQFPYSGPPPPVTNHSLGPGFPNSPVASGRYPRHDGLNMRFPSAMGALSATFMEPWRLNGGCNLDEAYTSSLLEEFKSNKSKCVELSEIAGHVVEFSADQYGSRFIQQRLETASSYEKNMIYQEIMPQALPLMTDVFGNYVIQKFFEHGLSSQRRELASTLFGHVLTFSLQMYGCRVIQKAIEMVDVDQKVKMVEELDGQVMRCVRDQNGNHVIQKCIECVPEGNIQFIISTFYDQVVSLSTHPYGCRVIQRILEHCKDLKTQSKVMDEILGAVTMLAQDQYGNYVVQHVLEHGKSHERSAIIRELAGKIVQMSQQKFASNVVEKCLTFGDFPERELLVNEMLGTTDENQPLQAMMKDQFANYVVQKVLETCNDQQRELILTRIKIHLNSLKKYTYGKHIVARVEKLVAAGERRVAAQYLQAV